MISYRLPCLPKKTEPLHSHTYLSESSLIEIIPAKRDGPAWFEIYIVGQWYILDEVQQFTGGFRIEIDVMRLMWLCYVDTIG